MVPLTLAALFSALVLPAAFSKRPSQSALGKAADALEAVGLVPLVVPRFAPSALVDIAFPASNGSFITISTPGQAIAVPDAQKQPVLSIQASDADGTFVFVIIDPDAPSPANPTASQILHFMQSGITLGSQSRPGVPDGFRELVINNLTAPLGPFMGPAPPVGSGFHRYTAFLFAQPDSFDPPANITQSGFSLQTFQGAMGLGDPIAGTFFRARND